MRTAEAGTTPVAPIGGKGGKDGKKGGKPDKFKRDGLGQFAKVAGSGLKTDDEWEKDLDFQGATVMLKAATLYDKLAKEKGYDDVFRKTPPISVLRELAKPVMDEANKISAAGAGVSPSGTKRIMFEPGPDNNPMNFKKKIVPHNVRHAETALESTVTHSDLDELVTRGETLTHAFPDDVWGRKADFQTM